MKNELPDDILETERFIKNHMKMTAIILRQEADKIDKICLKLERGENEEFDTDIIELAVSRYVCNLMNVIGTVSSLGLDNLITITFGLKEKISKYKKERKEGAIEATTILHVIEEQESEGRTEFYGKQDWEVREDTDDVYILEQKNCPKNSQEICRDFRILGAEKRQDEPGVNGEVWILYRALDDGRGIHTRKELIIVRGTKEDAIDELNCYRD